MNIEKLNGWVLIAGTLINMGIHTINEIKAIFGAAGLTEAEINEVLAAIGDDATKRRAVSAAIAFGA